jgi:GNAT superfamily N-acetyltransferase
MSFCCLTKADFQLARAIWSQSLWPGRHSEIEATSAIGPDGRISLLNHREIQSIFLVAKDRNEETIGLVSGFPTGDRLFRSRGLWVGENWRRRGIGRFLMAALESHARSENCDVIWTMPRKSSAGFYQSLGFQILGDTPVEYEFGPHVMATKILHCSSD